MSKQILFKAPDISEYQGAVNFKAMRDAGYSRVILRAGYGKNNVDKKLVSNILACVNLIISTAIYWFSYAYTVDMAIREAQYAIANVGKYFKKCPIAFDLEYDTVRYASTKGIRITKELATNMAIAFLQEVTKAGYIPVLYTNRDYMKNYFDWDKIKSAVPGVKLWFALYGNGITDAELSKSDLWQYTSKGCVTGISGNVDINNVYTDIWDVDAVEIVPQEPVCNLYIQSFQLAANLDGYKDQNGKRLVEDGLDGAKTQYVRRQINLMAKRTKLLWVERSEGYVVKWLQTRLNECMGAGLTVTGEYDDATKKAVQEFQKKYNLHVDGVAGYNTIQMLFYN